MGKPAGKGAVVEVGGQRLTEDEFAQLQALDDFLRSEEEAWTQRLRANPEQARADLEKLGGAGLGDSIGLGLMHGFTHGASSDIESALPFKSKTEQAYEKATGRTLAPAHAKARAANPTAFMVSQLAGALGSGALLRVAVPKMARGAAGRVRERGRLTGGGMKPGYESRARAIEDRIANYNIKSPRARALALDAGHGAAFGYFGVDPSQEGEEVLSPERLARAGGGAAMSALAAPIATSAGVAASNIPLAFGKRRAFSRKMLEPPGVTRTNPRGYPEEAIRIARGRDESIARASGEGQSVARDTAPPLASTRRNMQELADAAIEPVAAETIAAAKARERGQAADAIAAAYPAPGRPSAPQPQKTIGDQRTVARMDLEDGRTYELKADVFADRDAAVMSPDWPTNAFDDLSSALKHQQSRQRARARGMDVVNDPPRSPDWQTQHADAWSSAQQQVADKFVDFARSQPKPAHVLALIDGVDVNGLATRIQAQLPDKQMLISRDKGELAIVDKSWLRNNEAQFERWSTYDARYNQSKGVLPQPPAWALDGVRAPLQQPRYQAPARPPESNPAQLVNDMMEAFVRQDVGALGSWIGKIRAANRKDPAILPAVQAAVARQLAMAEREGWTNAAGQKLNDMPQTAAFLRVLGMGPNAKAGRPGVLEAARAPAREANSSGRFQEALQRREGKTPMRPRHAEAMRSALSGFEPDAYTGPAVRGRGAALVARGDDKAAWVNPLQFFGGKSHVTDDAVQAAGLISSPLAFANESWGPGSMVSSLFGHGDDQGDGRTIEARRVAPDQFDARPRGSAPIDRNRKILENEDGSFSTERTITVERGGVWYNIPTIIDGVAHDPDEVQQRFENGEELQTVGAFDTLEEAEAAAQARSAEIAKVRGGDRVPRGPVLKPRIGPGADTGDGAPPPDRRVVREIQRLLLAHGVDVGPHGEDGKLGPDTLATIESFGISARTDPARMLARLKMYLAARDRGAAQ